MALELTGEMQEQFKEVCSQIIRDDNDKPKKADAKRKRIKTTFEKKDLVLKSFLNNYVDLGNIINKASVEDVNESLASFGTSSIDETKLKELEEERAKLREQINEISKEIIALRTSAKNNRTITVK